ncbi:MAG: hypothetical protein WC822_01920 [Candidatus Paceibacterota bacterium]|jgi:hypothetical protein
MKNKKIVLAIVGILILAGAFYGGMSYGENKTPALGADRFGSNMQNRTGQFGANARDNRMGGGGLIAGEIISKDDKSVTVKMMTGGSDSVNTSGSKIIFFDTSTTVSKMATGATSDLTIGAQISATGTANSDGSITAKTIQIRDKISEIK